MPKGETSRPYNKRDKKWYKDTALITARKENVREMSAKGEAPYVSQYNMQGKKVVSDEKIAAKRRKRERL